MNKTFKNKNVVVSPKYYATKPFNMTSGPPQITRLMNHVT